MGWIKKIISLFLVFCLLALLVLYWFIPQNSFRSLPNFNTTNFSVNSEPNNFSTSGSNSTMQFYPNMRYSEREISYNILNCPIDRKQEMLVALDILDSRTILDFIAVDSNPEIEISCEDKVVESESGLFIAGEGGPTNITLLKNYNLITKGKVLLLKTSKCSTPDIALHELLHALGFVHSENPQNIMYPVNDCGQELSQDIIDTIDRIYSVESLPDLSIEKANAEMDNHYLDLNLSVKNIGLKSSDKFKVNIYINGNLKEELDGDALDSGFGRTTMLTNIFISAVSIREIKLEIIYNNPELQKDNNIMILE